MLKSYGYIFCLLALIFCGCAGGLLERNDPPSSSIGDSQVSPAYTNYGYYGYYGYPYVYPGYGYHPW
jgi:hypothetical protein